MNKKGKIIQLQFVKNERELVNKKASGDPIVRLEAELDYKTIKLLEALDTAMGRIESLERTQRYLIKILKESITQAVSDEETEAPA